MFVVHLFVAYWELMIMITTMSPPFVEARPFVEKRRALSVRHSPAVYRRRRAVVGGITAVFVAVTLVTAHDVLVGSGGVPASAATGQLARSSVVAQPGDTLWSIAGQHRGDVDVSTFVDKLVELNDGASIYAGQRVVLP